MVWIGIFAFFLILFLIIGTLFPTKQRLEKKIKNIKDKMETKRLKYEKVKGNLGKDLEITEQKLKIFLEKNKK